jgi:hypothetical protein
MPLMVLGARQVGKTYSLNEFCKENYDNCLYINLETEEDIRAVFENHLDPKRIIDMIAVLKGIKVDIENTVVFFDEIQLSERAITSLKYFNEAEEEYNIVCAGSMLGVALNRFKGSFPVGKVYRQYMYPLDFEEYLWGLGENLLAEEIVRCYMSNEQLIEPIHKKALELYKEYLYVGGMPSSINEFVTADRMLSAYDETIKRSILEDYLSDMSKYTTSVEHLKITKLYKSIPRQLGRDNNKFSYKLVEEKGSRRTFETSLDWLNSSYLTNKCTLVDFPEIPLSAYEKDSFFKIYLNDVGLLTELAGFTKKDIYSDEMKLFSGMLTENYVANMLTAGGMKLYYWKSKHNAEIDFLINIEGSIIPVEVKASGNTKSKSLKVYMDKYKPVYAIRVSGKNFGMTNGIKSVPLYSAFMIK